MRKILFVLALILFSSPAFAQTIIAVDIAKAKLSWTWTQGTNSSADEFLIKCGHSTAIYTKITAVPVNQPYELGVSIAIDAPGIWFCVVSARNKFGESGDSNVVNFEAGSVPNAPTNAQIVSQ